MDAVEKKKIPSLRRESNPDHPIFQPMNGKNYIIGSFTTGSAPNISLLG
jgi:hypothetical protein